MVYLCKVRLAVPEQVEMSSAEKAESVDTQPVSAASAWLTQPPNTSTPKHGLKAAKRNGKHTQFS